MIGTVLLVGAVMVPADLPNGNDPLINRPGVHTLDLFKPSGYNGKLYGSDHYITNPPGWKKPKRKR